jgi:small subunit ribosomal protein S20
MYIIAVANTQSAKKAIRGSERKRQHNLFWKRRIAAATKNLRNVVGDEKADEKLVNENLMVLQKILDKAAKKNVIHKNKANRLKSRYAKKASAHENKLKETKSKVKKAGKTAGSKPKARNAKSK